MPGRYRKASQKVVITAILIGLVVSLAGIAFGGFQIAKAERAGAKRVADQNVRLQDDAKGLKDVLAARNQEIKRLALALAKAMEKLAEVESHVAALSGPALIDYLVDSGLLEEAPAAEAPAGPASNVPSAPSANAGADPGSQGR